MKHTIIQATIKAGVALACLSCLSCLCGCSVDPYNALIWNRENAAPGNANIDTGPWYEWWYYKLVLPETGDAFYFVYGVVNPWDTSQTSPFSCSYVGCGSSAANECFTQRYPVAAFGALYSATDVHVAGQHATDRAISGGVTAPDGQWVSWDIQIDKRWQYNAMGWGMFVPEVSNIYWYPAQADARFSGWINYKGRLYQFEEAPGYQDRNWGRTFPEWWAWIVANHFDGHPDTALAVGGGRPVILGVTDAFQGLTIGLRHEGVEYAFRPNEGNCERITVNFGTWQAEAVNLDGYRIEVDATAPCDSFLDLIFRTPQGEEFHDFESLTGEVTVRLYKHAAFAQPEWQLLDTLHSDLAGIEYGHANITLFDCFQSEAKVLFSNF